MCMCIENLAHRVANPITNINQRLREARGCIVSGIDSMITPVATALQTVAVRTWEFVKNNWKPLITYLIAWAVVLTSTGLMYGFQAVALPLTIGLGCGLVVGVIAGILIVHVFDPNGKTTFWNLVNQVIQRLDPNGTRQIVLSVVITVLLAACVVYPYVMGTFLGIFVGNQLATKIAAQKNLGRDPKAETAEKERLQQNIESMRGEIDQLKSKMEKVQNGQAKEKISGQIEEMIKDLQEMTHTLERLYPKEDQEADNEAVE
jgi:MFS superfamily sulfate permease-like transporter